MFDVAKVTSYVMELQLNDGNGFHEKNTTGEWILFCDKAFSSFDEKLDRLTVWWYNDQRRDLNRKNNSVLRLAKPKKTRAKTFEF